MSEPTERDREAADLILSHFQAAEMKQITWTEAGENVQRAVALARAEEREACKAIVESATMQDGDDLLWSASPDSVLAEIEARGKEGK